jgi:hypothetical protein
VFKELLLTPGEFDWFSDSKRRRVLRRQGRLYEASWELRSLIPFYEGGHTVTMLPLYATLRVGDGRLTSAEYGSQSLNSKTRHAHDNYHERNKG